MIIFETLLKQAVFFEEAGEVAEIFMSLKSNLQINLSLSKSLTHTVAYEFAACCMNSPSQRHRGEGAS